LILQARGLAAARRKKGENAMMKCNGPLADFARDMRPSANRRV